MIMFQVNKIKFGLNFDWRIPEIKSVYAQTIEELERPHVSLYLNLLCRAMEKRQLAEKKFVSDYKNKETVIKEYSKYECIVYYLFMRMSRECKKYGSA
jgi:hypothetical protein